MKPIKRCALLVIFAGIGAAQAQTKPAAAAAAPDMKPGLWEIVLVEQAPNAVDKRTTTSRICYSAEDMKELERVVPPQRDFSVKCQNRDIRSQGASVTWKLACAGKDTSRSGTGKMTPATDSYTAQVAFDVKSKGKTSKLEQTVTGKWVSDCK